VPPSANTARVNHHPRCYFCLVLVRPCPYVIARVNQHLCWCMDEPWSTQLTRLNMTQTWEDFIIVFFIIYYVISCRDYIFIILGALKWKSWKLSILSNYESHNFASSSFSHANSNRRAFKGKVLTFEKTSPSHIPLSILEVIWPIFFGFEWLQAKLPIWLTIGLVKWYQGKLLINVQNCNGMQTKMHSLTPHTWVLKGCVEALGWD
jgi:hypothetical protein